MEIILGMLIAVGGILIVLVLRSLTTFFHEMGHAIPALFFSKGQVKVFVGTYGDINNGISLNIGRLFIYFRFNLLDWKMGMCQHKGINNGWHLLLVILGGPFMSTLIAIPLLFLIIYGGFSEIWISIMGLFIMAAAIDFFVNIIPTAREIHMYNGSVSYNDGRQIQILLSRLFLSEEYFVLEEKYAAGNYTEVIEEAKRIIEKGTKDRAIYQIQLEALMQENRYEDALASYKVYHQHYKLKDSDYRIIGQIYFGLHQYDDALKYINHCLHRNYTDTSLLHLRARIHIAQGDYQEALIDLNSAIHHQPRIALFYAQRAFVKLRLKQEALALEDLQLAQKVDPNESMVYYYLGQVWEEKGELQLALENYQKAKAMGAEEHGLDFKIDTLEAKIAS